MKKILIPLIIIPLIIVILSLSKDQGDTNDKPQIATSFNVLRFITEEIAGDDFEVISIIPSGVEPHNYEPLPKDQALINDSSIVFYIGLGFDNWIYDLVDPNIPSFDLSKDMPQIDPEDPHYWLSYTHAGYMAEKIAQELKKIFPEAETNIEENLTVFKEKLQQERKDALDRIRTMPRNAIITEHDAYRYFASDLGLRVVGNIEAQAEGEITPEHISSLLSSIEGYSIRTIYKEHGSNSDLINILEKEHGLNISYLDSEGILSSSYFDMMKFNVDNIVEGLN